MPYTLQIVRVGYVICQNGLACSGALSSSDTRVQKIVVSHQFTGRKLLPQTSLRITVTRRNPARYVSRVVLLKLLHVAQACHATDE